MDGDTRLIKLPTSLGIRVNEILSKKIEFTPRKGSGGLLSLEFTEDELALIDKLVIDNPSRGELKGVELLPKLRSLIVRSKGDTPFIQDGKAFSISDEDGACISRCKNLENLYIENQKMLTYLDVSQLKKLHYLALHRNAQFEEIYGLESLDQLWDLELVGNECLTRIEGLDNVIINNPELTEMELDLLLYPDAIGYDARTDRVNEEALRRLEDSNVSWQEVLYDKKRIIINNPQMKIMHQKALQALDEYVPPNGDNITKIVGIEQFFAENVRYDNPALDSNHTHSSQGIASGPLGGANGAYNAFMFKTCVCEGYTRAMQYLLRLKGIKSRNVSCISGEDKLHMSTNKGDDKYIIYDLPDDGYHSIISIDDMGGLYDDPCWNAGKFQKRGDKTLPYTLLTKSEISRDHTLSFIERRLDNETYRIGRDTIQAAIDRVKKYREERRQGRVMSQDEISRT